MPDISMCLNKVCPSRLECYRYRAVPSKWRQSYGCFSHNAATRKCEYFWPTTASSSELKDIRECS